MTRFHSDEYIDFLYRVTPDTMNEYNKHQHKCTLYPSPINPTSPPHTDTSSQRGRGLSRI